MSVSSVNSDPSEEDLSTQKPSVYHYDLRLEIGVKNDSGTIPVVAIFYDLVRRLKEAADDGCPVAILTATDKPFHENEQMSRDDFQKQFQVDNTEGKVSKVLLGFKMHSMTKLTDLKRRLMHTYLIPHNLFLRTHAGGFQHGVKTYSYGFLKDDHPDHPDIGMLTQRFARLTNEAWKKLDKDEKNKWRKALPQTFSDHAGLVIPVLFTKERVAASYETKEKISTSALMVSTPLKYGRLLKSLLDVAIAAKKLNNLIPFALSRDNPEGYYFVVAHQARFIENHRNIPIMEVPADASLQPGKRGETLLGLLNGNSAIHRVVYDFNQNKYHVSTTAAKYREIHQWITKSLDDHQFPYGPKVRPMKYVNGSNGASPLSYSEIFKDTISMASDSYTTRTVKPPQTNAWKNRPPFAISYDLNDATFPVLSPTKTPTPATPSTTSETFEEDTIQSAISIAIKKLEDQHSAALKKLKQEMQSKIDEVSNQMKELGQQVATQTYQALVKEGSPLATKTDHAHLQHEMSMISTQLATLIGILKKDAINLPSALPDITPQSPPRHSKRSKPTTTPEKKPAFDQPLTQDYSVSSATSDLDEGMEGCEG